MRMPNINDETFIINVYLQIKRLSLCGLKSCHGPFDLQFLLTPLHLAAWYGRESVVELLLQHGADVNAVDRVSSFVLRVNLQWLTSLC